MTRYLDLTFRRVITCKYSSFYCDQAGQLTSVNKHYYLFISNHTLLSSHIWFTHLSFESKLGAYLSLHVIPWPQFYCPHIAWPWPHIYWPPQTIFGVHIELQYTLMSVMGRGYPTWVVFVCPHFVNSKSLNFSLVVLSESLFHKLF